MMKLKHHQNTYQNSARRLGEEVEGRETLTVKSSILSDYGDGPPVKQPKVENVETTNSMFD